MYSAATNGARANRAVLLGADNADNWPAAESLVELARLAAAAGINTRGPGETKLESDRRRIRTRIAALGREIEQVRQLRSLHRQQRRASGIPVAALVGYTNAGKSTLMNALTGAHVLSSDQLF